MGGCLVFRREFFAEFATSPIIVAAVGAGAGAFAEHPVEAVREEVERFVGVVGADAGDEIGAADLDVAAGSVPVIPAYIRPEAVRPTRLPDVLPLVNSNRER